MNDDNLVLASSNVQPAIITYNYEVVKKCVELKAQQYAGIIVTDDNLKQAKQDRANLASARVAIVFHGSSNSSGSNRKSHMFRL